MESNTMTQEPLSKTERIIQTLGEEIVAGKYVPGAALPAEAELCERFSTSRNIIREVYRSLMAKRLMEMKRYRGAFVTSRNQWNYLDSDVLQWALAHDHDPRLIAPFMSLADLAGLQNDKGAVFGNEKQWGVDGPSENWDDQGREALFVKVANLVTFRSRCFRVYVSGQLIDAAGKVLGSRTSVIAYATESARDSDGSILPDDAPTVTYFYERSL